MNRMPSMTFFLDKSSLLFRQQALAGGPREVCRHGAGLGFAHDILAMGFHSPQATQ